MLRRSHKKTRRGAKCEECRRRHIRCDQRRPVCINCSQADRACSYRDTPVSAGTSAGSPDSASTLRSSDAVRSPSSAGSLSNPPTPNSQDSEPPDSVNIKQPANASSEGIINLTHLELFMHFSEIVPALFAGPDPEMQAKYLKIYNEAAFTGPYLMHEVLAFAARHLSLTNPDPKSTFYVNQATALQTTALSMFRASIREQSPETSLPSFLFSSLLGTHILTDTAAMRDLHLTEFLAHFFDYIKVHRGVRPIFEQYRAVLLNSELRPFLAWGWNLTTTKLVGTECSSNRDMIARSNFSPDEVEACNRAIDLLQAIIDGCKARPAFPGPAPWVTVWLSIVSPTYTELLLARRPEALVIFAHYGAMMHHFFSDFWLVGESGKRIIQMVRRSLGPAWSSCLQWPIEVVGEPTPAHSEEG